MTKTGGGSRAAPSASRQKVATPDNAKGGRGSSPCHRDGDRGRSHRRLAVEVNAVIIVRAVLVGGVALEHQRLGVVVFEESGDRKCPCHRRIGGPGCGLRK
eukprot:gene17682-biopygen14424